MKLLDFLKKYGQLIIIIMLSIIFLKQCSINSKYGRSIKVYKELTNELRINDSILNNNLNLVNHKLDSTLISNSAVVNSNNATSSAINNQKQQQVVVKVVKTKE